MSTDGSRRTFNLQVDAWVNRAVSKGVSSFDELLSTLPGVYPTQALASLRRLRTLKHVGAMVAARMEREARGVPAFQPGLRNALLPPHPLDFEWRFSHSAGNELLTKATQLSAIGDCVLLLGTPTLGFMVGKQGNRATFIYVGEDNAISHQVRAFANCMPIPLETRLCGPDAIRRDEAKVVVLDPPWYFDYLRVMLRAAAYACRPGGHVLVSLPPIGTNTHAVEDSGKILRLFAKLSLNLISIERGAIIYDTPYFEANALAAEGYPNIPKAWRRGDLFILEKAYEPVSIQFASRARPREWDEVVIGRMRVFITRNRSEATRDKDLYSLIEGDVLPSVKRGDPRRQNVQVWTSGNRIFGSRRPDLVRLGALAAASGGLVDEENRLSPQDRDAVVRLSYVLGELAVIEQAEERRGRLEEANCLIESSRSKSANWPTTSRTTRSGAST